MAVLLTVIISLTFSLIDIFFNKRMGEWMHFPSKWSITLQGALPVGNSMQWSLHQCLQGRSSATVLRPRPGHLGQLVLSVLLLPSPPLCWTGSFTHVTSAAHSLAQQPGLPGSWIEAVWLQSPWIYDPARQWLRSFRSWVLHRDPFFGEERPKPSLIVTWFDYLILLLSSEAGGRGPGKGPVVSALLGRTCQSS